MRTRLHVPSTLVGFSLIGPVLGLLGFLGAPAPPAGGLTPEQMDVLSHLSVEFPSDNQGGVVKTIVLEGANLQIRNGLGATNTVNGLGNLIVGYNEEGTLFGTGANNRTGSHNVVTGVKHNYPSYGGLVAGEGNTISGPHATVSGGAFSLASGRNASVSGGFFVGAQGNSASAIGGSVNSATGAFTTVVGGNNIVVTQAGTTGCGCP